MQHTSHLLALLNKFNSKQSAALNIILIAQARFQSQFDNSNGKNTDQPSLSD
jgi:hypothetical protein